MELEKLPHLLRPSLCLSALSPRPWIMRWRKVGWHAGKPSRMFPEVEKGLSC